jgi:hypothetical protein
VLSPDQVSLIPGRVRLKGSRVNYCWAGGRLAGLRQMSYVGEKKNRKEKRRGWAG